MIIPPLVQSGTEKLPGGVQRFEHSQVRFSVCMRVRVRANEIMLYYANYFEMCANMVCLTGNIICMQLKRCDHLSLMMALAYILV